MLHNEQRAKIMFFIHMTQCMRRYTNKDNRSTAGILTFRKILQWISVVFIRLHWFTPGSETTRGSVFFFFFLKKRYSPISQCTIEVSADNIDYTH